MMKDISRTQSLVWGGLLIVFGLMGLAESYFDLTVWAWAGALGLAGLGVLLVYLSDRSKMWPLIPAYALLMIAGFLALIELNVLDDPFIATFVLSVIALPFLYVFFMDRANWWALIPAYVLLSIGLMVPLVEFRFLKDAFVATYVLGTIALPFIVIYFRDRQNWWALIPAYTLLVVGFMVGLIETRLLSDLIIPAYIMFAIAVPFLFVYFRNPKEWWPLIPSGIMGIMGMGFLLAERSTRIVAPILVIAFGVAIILRQILRSSGGNE
jgi:TM2 domain-containing membrane protein YozV